jgi:hypothetical protein
VRVYAFISDQKTEFPIETLCWLCGVSRSAFYEREAARPGLSPVVRGHESPLVARSRSPLVAR